MADAQGMRRRFIDAVGSEKELEGPVDVALEAEDELGEEERETVAAADHPVAASTVRILAKVPAGIVHEQEGDAGATMILPRAWLVSRQENGSTSDYRLGPMETVIGRSPKSDIRVVNDTVSRQHAKLTAGPQGYVISDLGSENGTLINRERVDTRLLVDKDIIRIGPAEFEFRQI